MNALLRASACAVVLFGAILLVGCVLVPWLGGPSLFPDDLHAISRAFLEESQRQDSLDERNRVIADVLVQKREITDDVITGRASLPEAVGKFRHLRDEMEDGINANSENPSWPVVSDEMLALNVMSWVSVALGDDPRHDEVINRLESEYDASKVEP